MFEYITVLLQVILVVAIIACIGRVLFSMGLNVYRDRLWNRLTELECLVLEKKSDGSMSTEFANDLLECTKKLRADFEATIPEMPILEFVEILANPEVVPDDKVVAGRIFFTYLSFLATKSVVALFVVIALCKIANSRKNPTKSVLRYDSSAPTSGVAHFIQALCGTMPVKSV